MEFILVQIGIVGFLLLLYVSIIFLLAQWKEDNSIMDIAYGPAFLFSIGGAIILTQTYALLPILLLTCIALWSIRLSTRIFKNHLGKAEDFRYAKWRAEWSAHGRWYFLLRSYIQINVLQGIIILLIAMPAIISLAFPFSYSLPTLLLGTFVFAGGLLYETIADYQLDRFIARKKTGEETATLMTQGLFKYSRRPNYFGETLVWWGLAIIVIPLHYGWLALISPLLITFIVTKVTGPMLENAFLEKYPKEYVEYMKTTNYLVPGAKKTLT
jgi:steroid 5-alpha reductase family enzyme